MKLLFLTLLLFLSFTPATDKADHYSYLSVEINRFWIENHKSLSKEDAESILKAGRIIREEASRIRIHRAIHLLDSL